MNQPDDTLANYRRVVDELDEKIVLLLAERFQVTRKIGAHKRRVGLAAADKGREADQFKRIGDLARSSGLNEALALRVYRLIVDEVVANHRAM